MLASEGEARKSLFKLHAQLKASGLVVWTGGNISQRIKGGFLIKPSGLEYEELTPESMVLCDFDGSSKGSNFLPSSDTASHAYVYRNMPEVNGIVHTHSNYAAAWAAAGKPIPCVLTAIADEFGGEIPLGPFAKIGDDSIGQGIAETLRGHRSKAVLNEATWGLFYRRKRQGGVEGCCHVRGRRKERLPRPEPGRGHSA